VSQLDAADDSLEFVGEDTIEHTPREEKISVKLGNAFDIVGERRITDTKRNNDRKFLIQTVEVTLRNRKTEPVDVVVLERLIGYTGWRVVEETDEHRKKDAQSIEYPVTLEPDEEKVITYTVRYTW
jgi:hypothetical protein